MYIIFFMYLAANGKIYITSGNSVQHLHEINYPDSAGVSCNLIQHAVNVGIWSFRAVPNHPNYYLGCDTTLSCPCLAAGISEHQNEIINFQIKPNPNNGNFTISYLLPQNKSGTFEVFDINGRKVYSQALPQWSTLQQINLPKLSGGIYQCIIKSGNSTIAKKVAVIRESSFSNY